MNRLMRSAVYLAVGALFSCAVWASSVLDDSDQGMTCHYYSAAARLEWGRQGGDWFDVRGVAYGEEPYSTSTVPRLDARQIVQIDVTDLVKRWRGDGAAEASIMLRDVSGGGVVNFASRENADATARPSLVIEWSDGSRSRLTARADTFFSCPDYRSYGREPQLKVGGRQAALLIFPLNHQGNGGIRSAWLMLSSDKQYGKGNTVGAFLASFPGSGVSRVEAGLADVFDGDDGIAEHPDVIRAIGVGGAPRHMSWRDLDSAPGGRVVESDPANRFEPLKGEALAVTIAKGSNGALNAHIRFDDAAASEPEEAFFRYYLRFGENWNPAADGGKLPGFSGTYGRAGWGMRKSDGHNGWSARGAFFRQAEGAAGDLRGVGSYVYHARMDGASGETWGWSLGPSGLLHKNRWYSIEQHVKLNTPGKADGVLRAWVDGQLVFERSDIRYRDNEALKIESVWLNVYHGGVTPASNEMTLYIDNLVIARKYIGPMRRAQ